MESPNGAGLVAVCAVSGSVVLLALQAHKRLLSNFMKRMELQLKGPKKSEARRSRVRRLIDNAVPSSEDQRDHRLWQRAADKGNYYRKHSTMTGRNAEEIMPANRQILYRGMLNYRNFRSQNNVPDYF